MKSLSVITSTNLLMLLLVCTTSAISQTKIIVRHKATTGEGACSNIVALAGNVNLNCSSLTPAQQQLLKRIPELLGKILAGQTDPQVMSKKLDEVIASLVRLNQGAQNPVVNNSAPGGIVVSGSTDVTASVTNIAADRWRGPKVDMVNLVDGLKGLQTGTAAIALYQPADQEMENLGGHLQLAFRRAGWQLNNFPPDTTERGWFKGSTDVRSEHAGLHCVTDGSELSQRLVAILSADGVKCSMSDASLYPPPRGTNPTITFFVGRSLD